MFLTLRLSSFPVSALLITYTEDLFSESIAIVSVVILCTDGSILVFTMICLELLSFFVSTFYLTPFSDYLLMYGLSELMTEVNLYKGKEVPDRYDRRRYSQFDITRLIVDTTGNFLAALWQVSDRKDVFVIVASGTAF